MEPFQSCQGKKKHININKFAGLSRDWVGAENLFMFFFSFGSFLMGEKKHINKITPQIPGQSRENFVYVFCSLCVFFAPYNDLSFCQDFPSATEPRNPEGFLKGF